eukprot:6817849-Heterocapsa_arctica.AAC.1
MPAPIDDAKAEAVRPKPPVLVPMEEDEERPGARRRKAEVPEEGRKGRRRLKEKTGAGKRPRDKQMEEEQEMEEVLA